MPYLLVLYTTHPRGKTPTGLLDVEFIEASVDEEPDTLTRVPIVGPVKWHLKDLKMPKSNENAATHSTNAIEQWVSKWEQCF